MATEKVSNSAITTLNGAINNSTTSVVVTSATTFPTTGVFRIVIDSEIMKVTGVSSNTFTVVRGDEGTAAASHSDLANVNGILTADSVKSYRGDLIQYGAYASLPAAGQVGTTYLTSDGYKIYRDNGTSWQPMGIMQRMKVHDDSGFSWARQDTGSTITTTADYTTMLVTSANSNWSVRKKAISAPYTLTVCLSVSHPCGFAYGIGPMDSGSGKFVIMGNSWINGIRIIKQNSTTSYSADYTGGALNSGHFFAEVLPYQWWRFQDDNTNHKFYFSNDGVNFSLLKSVTRTDFLATPDSIMYTAQARDNDSYLTIHSWEET